MLEKDDVKKIINHCVTCHYYSKWAKLKDRHCFHPVREMIPGNKAATGCNEWVVSDAILLALTELGLISSFIDQQEELFGKTDFSVIRDLLNPTMKKNNKH